MNTEFLYGCLLIVAFVFFAVMLAVVSERTEAFLKERDKDNPDG